MSELLTCDVCDIGFRGRSDARYCSAACRQKAHRARTARRIAGLASRVAAKPRLRRAIIKPDVAATIRRAQHEQRRSHELCRAATDTLRMNVASQQRLLAIRSLTGSDLAAPASPWPDQDGIEATVEECG